jgi:hypothetical protein
VYIVPLYEYLGLLYSFSMITMVVSSACGSDPHQPFPNLHRMKTHWCEILAEVCVVVFVVAFLFLFLFDAMETATFIMLRI